MATVDGNGNATSRVSDSVVEAEKAPKIDPAQEADLLKLTGDFDASKVAGSDGKTQKEPSKETIGFISLMYAGVFGILAARIGEHWALKPDEVAMLAEPTALVMDKYFPDSGLGCEAALVGAVFLVVMPRLLVPQPIDGEVVEGVGNGDKSEH